ncbi:hypothetical protein ACHRV6_07005 [Flavobacterium sp. FlaQc-51]|uniref:hypothetical protein n=1 Tax=Flavobacterium sp. FlaQc-51 TaxID=3374184 RepID=UPI003756D7F9
MRKKKAEIIRRFYLILYKIKNWDWNLILLGFISLQIAILIFVRLHFYNITIDLKSSLELILTFNGLFSAILMSYFFNRISRTLDSKKEDYEEAVMFSQKITDFRRILKKLTDFYNVWQNDESTKGLFLSGKYKNVDYFDFKLSSYSDYEPKDINIIHDLYKEPRYLDGQSDLYLGMISLVDNRKSQYREYDSILYKTHQTKGIYNLKFISNCVEIDYAGRLASRLRTDYEYIRYNNLSTESKNYILELLERIDSKKFQNAELNNATMVEVCEDMNEHYFKELNKLLLRLNMGLSTFNLLIYLILILCLIFGVLLPFLTYFIFDETTVLKKVITEILIGVNFALLFFFIFSLYSLVKKEITWT